MAQVVELPTREAAPPTRLNRWLAAWQLTWRRFILGTVVTFIVTAVTFALLSLSPMDPLRKYLGLRYQHMEVEQRDEVRHALGLDAPWWQAWWDWLSGFARGDLGQSLIYHRPVTEVVWERLPWTLLLGAVAISLGVAVSMVLGIYSGLRPGSMVDRGATLLVSIVQSVPPFVLAVGAVFVFAVAYPVLPAAGISPPGQSPTAASVARHLVLPALLFALTQIPWLVLGVRESVIGAVRSPAVVAARMRGLSPRTIVHAHVFPLAVPPALALLGSRLPEFVVGAVIVETVFSWPGLAGALTEAALAADMPLLAVLTGLTTAAVIAGMWLADVLHVLIDPQVEVNA